MAQVCTIELTDWNARDIAADTRARALDALESGDVLFFPKLAFDAADLHRSFTNTTVMHGRKNVSLDPAREKVTGVSGAEREIVVPAMHRYAAAAHGLVMALFPRYAAALAPGRTSFRPVEIAGRATSWRKDDTRLHVDSFPATPMAGTRILRVFSNIDPQRGTRYWRIGESFERVASRYAPRLAAPIPGSSLALRALRITKTRRTPYDHYMLGIHDAMKADDSYQRNSAAQTHFEFPAGSTWLCYTDQVVHAAMKGHWALEQTFCLPVRAMADVSKSPLRTLESLIGRTLV